MLELNKIYNEDCLEGMKDIPDGSIDMILCDLPYGTTRLKWDSIIPLDELWSEYERIIKPNGAIVLTAIEPFASSLRTHGLNYYRHEWIWNKERAGNFMQAKNHPMRVHEHVLVFSKKKVNYYPIMTKADPKNIRPEIKNREQKTEFIGKVNKGFANSKEYNKNKLRYPKSILTYNARAKECNNINRIHPTQKPVDLFEYLINTYTKKGETVLDNCMGSGTTAIACINTNRNYIGFEVEKQYYDLANERIKKYLEEINNT